MSVQSVLFDKSKYTPEEAVIWLARHGFKLRKIDITENLLRFRQFDPRPDRQYRIKKLNKGVSFVLEY
jgi:hypothetical protein